MLLANGIILNPANPNTAKLGSINVLNDEILKLIMAYITTKKITINSIEYLGTMVDILFIRTLLKIVFAETSSLGTKKFCFPNTLTSLRMLAYLESLK